MPPPEVWGPTTWRLFHVLSARLPRDRDDLVLPLFHQFQNICRTLPCAECSKDATALLAAVNQKALRTPEDLVKVMFTFHNTVNQKKRKAMFTWEELSVYESMSLPDTVNQFFAHYYSRGNFQELHISMQRQRIRDSFRQWLQQHWHMFQSVVTNSPSL